MHSSFYAHIHIHIPTLMLKLCGISRWVVSSLSTLSLETESSQSISRDADITIHIYFMEQSPKNLLALPWHPSCLLSWVSKQAPDDRHDRGRGSSLALRPLLRCFRLVSSSTPILPACACVRLVRDLIAVIMSRFMYVRTLITTYNFLRKVSKAGRKYWAAARRCQWISGWGSSVMARLHIHYPLSTSRLISMWQSRNYLTLLWWNLEYIGSNG